MSIFFRPFLFKLLLSPCSSVRSTLCFSYLINWKIVVKWYDAIHILFFIIYLFNFFLFFQKFANLISCKQISDYKMAIKLRMSHMTSIFYWISYFGWHLYIVWHFISNKFTSWFVTNRIERISRNRKRVYIEEWRKEKKAENEEKWEINVVVNDRIKNDRLLAIQPVIKKMKLISIQGPARNITMAH